VIAVSLTQRSRKYFGMSVIPVGAPVMRRVLLATDGSSFSEEAAWFLSHLPHTDRLDLTVITVLDDPSIARNRAATVYLKESIEREKAMANDAYQKIVQMFSGANATLSHVVKEGHRGETVIQVAEQVDADLILVGARGHSMVGRLLLGSTSDFVATHASCSVMVYRPTGLRKLSRPLKITIGFEESAPARAALEEFAEINWGRQTEVHVVSVVSHMSGFSNEVVIDPKPITEFAKSKVVKAAKQLEPVAPNATSEVIASEHVGEGLVRFAENNECDLIVIGETPRSAIGRFLLGSFSRYVLRHAPCSVWISRTRVIRESKSQDVAELAFFN